MLTWDQFLARSALNCQRSISKQGCQVSYGLSNKLPIDQKVCHCFPKEVHFSSHKKQVHCGAHTCLI